MIERHKKLVKLFLSNPYTYLSANEIAEYLNVSNRTVRNDIKILNNEFENEYFKSAKSKGYVLNTYDYDIKNIHAILNPIIEKDSKTIINIAYKLLMNNEEFTLKKLEEEYFISKSELLNYLSRIALWCEKFDVKVEVKKKKGINILGSITDINNAILHLNQLSDEENGVEELILRELPPSHVKNIFNILNNILNHFDIKTSDYKIRQLVIHLILITKRRDINEVTWEVDSEALQISRKCISEINNRLKYNLNDETSKLFSFFISYHFNKFELGVEKIFIESYINRLISLMQDKIGVQFSEDKVLKENLYSHFSRTYLRIIKKVYLNNPLAGNIKKLYPFVFNILFEAIESLSKESGIILSEDEIAFLTIHFQSSIDRNEKSQFNIVIACYYGLGISSLLETKVTKLSTKINVIDTIKLEEIECYDFSNIDLLITTNEINRDNLIKKLDIMTVSPLFSKEDENKIKYYLNNKRNTINFKDKISSINIIVESHDEELEDMLVVFDKANTILKDNQAIHDNYIETALEREKFSSTYIGNGIAIPHGDPDKILKSYIIIFASKHEIKWKQYNANLVVFMAISKDNIDITKKVIQTIAKLSEKDIKNLIVLDNTEIKEKFISFMKE